MDGGVNTTLASSAPRFPFQTECQFSFNYDDKQIEIKRRDEDPPSTSRELFRNLRKKALLLLQSCRNQKESVYRNELSFQSRSLILHKML